jgi:hypothetical protein
VPKPNMRMHTKIGGSWPCTQRTCARLAAGRGWRKTHQPVDLVRQRQCKDEPRHAADNARERLAPVLTLPSTRQLVSRGIVAWRTRPANLDVIVVDDFADAEGGAQSRAHQQQDFAQQIVVRPLRGALALLSAPAGSI